MKNLPTAPGCRQSWGWTQEGWLQVLCPTVQTSGKGLPTGWDGLSSLSGPVQRLPPGAYGTSKQVELVLPHLEEGRALQGQRGRYLGAPLWFAPN